MMQSMSDGLIKRADVYKAIDDWLEGKVPNLNIKDIPSADRPKGEWIRDDIGTLICSECKRPRRDSRIGHTNFCNSCGADMREGETGEQVHKI